MNIIWLPICLFLAVFANAEPESSLTPVVPLWRAAAEENGGGEEKPQSPKKDGDECDADTLNNIVCENDKLKFCGPDNRITSIPCLVNGRQGFCNCEKSGCVAEKPVCSDEQEKCLIPGTKLPDNLDCHKFSYCNENKQKMMLQCPGELIYEPNQEKCTDLNGAYCSRVVCPRPGNSLQLVPFPQAKNYYVLCYKGMGDVRKCNDKYYGVRNNACQFDCKLRNASGLFRDTNLRRCKEGIYYACRRAGTNFTTVQAKCPKGKIFDESIGICSATATC